MTVILTLAACATLPWCAAWAASVDGAAPLLKAAEAEAARLEAVRAQLAGTRLASAKRVETLRAWQGAAMRLTMAAMAGQTEWQAAAWDSEAVAKAVGEKASGRMLPATEKELYTALDRADQAWAAAGKLAAGYRKEAVPDEAAWNGRRMARLAEIQPLSSALSTALAAEETLLSQLDRRLAELGVNLPVLAAQAAALRVVTPPPPERPVLERKP